MVINKLFDFDDFNNPEFVATAKEFGENTNSFSSGLRKSWEFTIMSYGLTKLGCLDGSKEALGLGCLKENLIYYYANKTKHVTATDVAYYPRSDKRLKAWGTEMYSVDEVYNAGVNYDKSKLTVIPMDMAKIEFPDESFDFVWSSSSVEHVGHIPEVMKVFTEVQRVLRPNGIFSITSEWNLDPNGKGVQFANVQSFDPYVMDIVSKTVPKLHLVEPITLDRSNNPKNREKEYMLGKTNHWYGSAIDYTSISLFWRKE
jgi:SAM-dependent methyltransferase